MKHSRIWKYGPAIIGVLGFAFLMAFQYTIRNPFFRAIVAGIALAWFWTLLSVTIRRRKQ